MNSKDALGALLLLGGLAAALLLAPDSMGPGPLALCTAVAAGHAALIAPALAREAKALAYLPLLLYLPVVVPASFGHPFAARFGSLLLVALCCTAGWAGRILKPAVYLPAMLALFGMPYLLEYLVREFGKKSASAPRWLNLSPLHAAGSMPAATCIALLLAAPVIAVALAARRRSAS